MAANPTQTPPDSENYRKDIAGRFFQRTSAKTFELFRRWLPQGGMAIEEPTRRIVEEDGLLEEGIAVILNWFRSDDDAKWLEDFATSSEGSRFLELTIEIYARAMTRQFQPKLPIPPVCES
jgi:hypothetical protein